MENVEKSLQMDVIGHTNLPFIQEEMTLLLLRGYTASRSDNTVKWAFKMTAMILEKQS